MSQPGTNAGSTPGFLTTTLRLCAGTQILTEIYASSPARAIWRFFLLTVLCAILASVVGTFVQKGTFERAGKALDEEIGAIMISPDRIYFEKAPDTPRRLKLPYVMLEYFPGDTFEREDFNVDRTSDCGFTILPGGLTSWGAMKNWDGEDIFFADLLSAHDLFNQLFSAKQPSPNLEMYSGPGLAETLRKDFMNPAKPETRGNTKADKATDTAKTPAEIALDEAMLFELTGSKLASDALSVLTAIILMSTFVRNLFHAGLIVLLVSLVQYLRASTLPKGLVFRNVLTIMVYSTFPAMIFASLFDAAGGGRYLPFQILFVIIFFVYQLFAFRAVMNKVCPQPERNDDDFDDSDF